MTTRLLGLVFLIALTVFPLERTLAQVPADSVVLVESLRIGAHEAAPEFRQISAAARSSQGGWYVADGAVPTIRRYGEAGDYLGTIGRIGGSPGEYKAVDGMAVIEGGELLVWDATSKRVSLFSESGEFVRGFSVERGVRDGRSFVAAPDGTLFLWRWVGEAPTETRDGLTAEWIRVTPRGEAVSLRPVPRAMRRGPEYALSGRGGYFRPFSTETVSAMGPDGSFYVARNDEYSILHIAADGSHSLLVRPETPVELVGPEVVQWEEWSRFISEKTLGARESFPPVPSRKPFFRDLLVDDSRRLWVSRYTPAVFRAQNEWEARSRRGPAPRFEWRDLPRWDVFSPGDRYCGFVVLPFSTSLLGGAGEFAWGVQEAPNSTEHFVVWRLHLATGGSIC